MYVFFLFCIGIAYILYTLYTIIDPCKTLGVRSHPYIGKCRAYWTCRRRRSDARCCPKGYGFGGGGSACIPDNNCHTECQTKTFVVENGMYHVLWLWK